MRQQPIQTSSATKYVNSSPIPTQKKKIKPQDPSTPEFVNTQLEQQQLHGFDQPTLSEFVDDHLPPTRMKISSQKHDHNSNENIETPLFHSFDNIHDMKNREIDKHDEGIWDVGDSGLPNDMLTTNIEEQMIEDNPFARAPINVQPVVPTELNFAAPGFDINEINTKPELDNRFQFNIHREFSRNIMPISQPSFHGVRGQFSTPSRPPTKRPSHHWFYGVSLDTLTKSIVSMTCPECKIESIQKVEDECSDGVCKTEYKVYRKKFVHR